MSWVKLDDQFADHPKVIAAGPLASWLYVCGLTYCSRYLTDGFIPAGQVRKLADLDDALALAEKLVDAGLWERADAGYQVHDYLDYNPAAFEAKAVKAVANERKAGGRVKGYEHVQRGARGRFQSKPPLPTALSGGVSPLKADNEHRYPSPSPSPSPSPCPNTQNLCTQRSVAAANHVAKGRNAPEARTDTSDGDNEDDDGVVAPTRSPAPRERPHNPLWDALVAAFYEPATAPERSKFGKVVRELSRAGATAVDVAKRCAHHAQGVENGVITWTLTPNALVSHWSELAKPPASLPRPAGFTPKPATRVSPAEPAFARVVKPDDPDW